MLSLRKYGKNPFVFEIYHSSMCTMVLLYPQPLEMFSLFSFFLNLQLFLSTEVQGTPLPFTPTGLVPKYFHRQMAESYFSLSAGDF